MPELTSNQAAAYDLLLPFLKGSKNAHLAVLEGYAGTGKTFLVARLLGALRGLKIAVAAPTNKAVRVLRDKLIEAQVSVADEGDPDLKPRERPKTPLLGCTCRSIHALLGMKLKEMDNGQQEAVAERDSSIRDYDVVVIDECSMLDETLFKKTVMERGQARVLFVGDPAQLPPVKAAGISPAFDRVNLKVRLSDVVRQAADNPIIRLSIRLRQLIEANVKATAMALHEVLPAIDTGPKAALCAGSPQTLVDWYLAQRADDPDSDTRIIAFTNDRVQMYNRILHHQLYGDTPTQFVSGETVIVHTQCEAEWINEDGLPQPMRLITSDELTVVESTQKAHPFYPHIAANRLVLRGMDGRRYRSWIATDEAALNRDISACFSEWRTLKMESERAGNDAERTRIKEQASHASAKGWALRRAFAPLRHAYAITCHKSQGSTFDCALVDFTDLSRMTDPFQFNRALYVAVTRSREFLAMVVT